MKLLVDVWSRPVHSKNKNVLGLYFCLLCRAFSSVHLEVVTGIGRWCLAQYCIVMIKCCEYTFFYQNWWSKLNFSDLECGVGAASCQGGGPQRLHSLRVVHTRWQQKIVSGRLSSDKTIRIWDAKTDYKQLACIAGGHQDSQYAPSMFVGWSWNCKRRVGQEYSRLGYSHTAATCSAEQLLQLDSQSGLFAWRRRQQNRQCQPTRRPQSAAERPHPWRTHSGILFRWQENSQWQWRLEWDVGEHHWYKEICSGIKWYNQMYDLCIVKVWRCVNVCACLLRTGSEKRLAQTYL